MRRILPWFIIAAILVIAIAYNRAISNAPHISVTSTTPSYVSEGIPVTVATASVRPSRRTLSVLGIIRSTSNVTITSQLPAPITHIAVVDGQKVSSGQLICELYSPDLDAQVSRAAAGLQSAEAQYRRADRGYQAKSIELSAQISQAQTALSTAQLRLNQAESAEKLTGIEAKSDEQKALAGLQQAKAVVQQAKAGLDSAAATLKRLTFLYQHGGVAKVDLDGAKTQYQVAQAQYQAAKAGEAAAQSAIKPVRQSGPLRVNVSEQDIEVARKGVAEARSALYQCKGGKKAALQIATAEIAAAAAGVSQAKAALNAADLQLLREKIVSPVTGVVVNLSAHVGDIAQPGQPICVVVSTRRAGFTAAITADQASLVKVGQPAAVISDIHPGQVEYGRVSYVSPAAGPDNRSFPIRISLPPGQWNPDLTAKAVINIAGNEQYVSIPIEAIHTEGAFTYVYVVKNDIALRRSVTVAGRSGEYMLISSGLQEGEKVIVSAPSLLTPGSRVHFSSQ
ncbi:MAG: efflux RND transporter periplasmic adaptor subunit [Armatimonadetes bacterium]|nr:efflux RND transporter periplasmic adaptor subunit [Armatimonadota bacterium]